MIEQTQPGQYIPRPETVPEQAIGKMSPEQARRIDVSAKQRIDPRGHRSDNTLCKMCIWFAPKVSTAGPTFDDFGHCDRVPYHIGSCRRHAPTMGGYPVVFVNDWCGDHRLDENKI